MNGADALRSEFDQTGRVWMRAGIDGAVLSNLAAQAEHSGRPGARVLMNSPLGQIVRQSSFSRRIEAAWPGMKPVRLVCFNKTADANWGVPWHQDRVIAVREKADVSGFSNWSHKSGAWHCEPPVSFLERMLFVRVHIDESNGVNGAMEIAIGSHRLGRVSAVEADAKARGFACETTEALPGDVLVLSMLTLHRSLPAVEKSGRRALRIDYCAEPLPAPLEWAQ